MASQPLKKTRSENIKLGSPGRVGGVAVGKGSKSNLVGRSGGGEIVKGKKEDKPPALKRKMACLTCRRRKSSAEAAGHPSAVPPGPCVYDSDVNGFPITKLSPPSSSSSSSLSTGHHSRGVGSSGGSNSGRNTSSYPTSTDSSSSFQDPNPLLYLDHLPGFPTETFSGWKQDHPSIPDSRFQNGWLESFNPLTSDPSTHSPYDHSQQRSNSFGFQGWTGNPSQGLTGPWMKPRFNSYPDATSQQQQDRHLSESNLVAGTWSDGREGGNFVDHQGQLHQQEPPRWLDPFQPTPPPSSFASTTGTSYDPLATILPSSPSPTFTVRSCPSESAPTMTTTEIDPFPPLHQDQMVHRPFEHHPSPYAFQNHPPPPTSFVACSAQFHSSREDRPTIFNQETATLTLSDRNQQHAHHPKGSETESFLPSSLPESSSSSWKQGSDQNLTGIDRQSFQGNPTWFRSEDPSLHQHQAQIPTRGGQEFQVGIGGDPFGSATVVDWTENRGTVKGSPTTPRPKSFQEVTGDASLSNRGGRTHSNSPSSAHPSWPSIQNQPQPSGGVASYPSSPPPPPPSLHPTFQSGAWW
ncbi:hypothetical protein IE53DRAFT_372190 [Violaceomyces palustris]|uniref:Uncharacterized protein n=1 Tax=Violaceomyces palustris TaxID=1673888 RepID=A0ACD0NLC8_9BASI|nr:hypothetical protein IE53DRAFT_372190 [Violaceomyces palustris]